MYAKTISLAAAAGCAILLMAGCAAEPNSPTTSGGDGSTVTPPSAATGAGGGGSKIDPCTLLTDDVLPNFTGTTGTTGTPSGDGCTFQLSEGASVTVTPKSITKGAFDDAMSSQGGTSWDGVGDEAFAQIGGDPITLWTWQDGVEVTVVVHSLSTNAAATFANDALYNIDLSK